MVKMYTASSKIRTKTNHFAVNASVTQILFKFDYQIMSDRFSGGFRGCSWGQLPPFMMKSQLGAPFSARRVPLILTQMHSFHCASFYMQETYKLRRCSIEKPEKFSRIRT